MIWNHRVIRTEHEGEYHYSIHEVHYDDADEIIGWTSDAIEVSAETRDGILWVLDKMKVAVANPVLAETTPEKLTEVEPAKCLVIVQDDENFCTKSATLKLTEVEPSLISKTEGWDD
jgi:hypothetical protein